MTAAALAALPPGFVPTTDTVSAHIAYYHDGAPLDTDNMVKPILDALTGVVYADDSQVQRETAERKDLNGPYFVRGILPHLAAAFSSNGPFVRIRIETTDHSPELT